MTMGSPSAPPERMTVVSHSGYLRFGVSILVAVLSALYIRYPHSPWIQAIGFLVALFGIHVVPGQFQANMVNWLKSPTGMAVTHEFARQTEQAVQDKLNRGGKL